jgi:amino acid adenylation domain-containing protein
MAYLLPHLLTATAGRQPEATAVECGGSTISYRELEEESNRIGHLLRGAGVRQGDRVGLFLHKSVETALGIFSILKAGAAYVPLDPNAPPARVAYIIRNCGIRCLLTTPQKLAALAKDPATAPALDLALFLSGDDGEGAASAAARVLRRADAAGEPATPPANDRIESDLAYILYTSGSTGDPKGVMITHRNSLTFVDWGHEIYGVGPSDHLSNHAPFHFDLSTFDLFVGVKGGATIHIVPEHMSTFPADLVKFIDRNRISVWYSVPSVLIQLTLHGKLSPGQFPHLRLLLFAGEVFPVKYLRKLMELLPHTQFHNLYGPTETNVCTYYHVRSVSALSADDTPIPIGKACENTEVFAVDESGKRVGQGETGELLVRGPSVAKGYWGLPEKTERALDLRADESGHRDVCYRTGDLVVLEPDGNYRFVGRRDHMIKSRGYRIELGDVEAALYRHPSVKEAVVLPIPDEQIGHSLRAVVVPSESDRVSKGDLVAHCAQILPKYMIPQEFDLRDFLPKTSTGKIDRQGLLKELNAGKV